MTKQEKVIVSAYTGYLMCDFPDVHKYIEEKMGRPVWTHEMRASNKEFRIELEKRVKPDFLALCAETDANLRELGIIVGDLESWDVRNCDIREPSAEYISGVRESLSCQVDEGETLDEDAVREDAKADMECCGQCSTETCAVVRLRKLWERMKN